MNFSVNIQSRPTATLYEKKKNREIFLNNNFRASILPQSAALHTVVVFTGSYDIKETLSTLSPLSALLRFVIVPIGSFDIKEIQSTIAPQSALLRTVIVSTGSFDIKEISWNSLGYPISANLKTVIIPVGSWSNETINTPAAPQSATLSPPTFSLVTNSIDRIAASNGDILKYV